MLLARELLPDAWAPPEDIQYLRDKTRLRKSLTDDHTRWAQRLHALLVHGGWPCSRGSLLTTSGRRWVAVICLHPSARAQINAMLGVMATLAHEIDCELRRLAKTDARLKALQQIYGIGSILSCTILAEIGDAKRFRRARQVVRAAGLDPVVRESADKRRRGHLAKQGAPGRRSSKPPSTPAARTAPTTASTAASAATPAPTPPPSPSPARSANAPSTSCAHSTHSQPPDRFSRTQATPIKPDDRGRGELLSRPGEPTRSPR